MFNKALKEEIEHLKWKVSILEGDCQRLRDANRRREPHGEEALKNFPDDLKCRLTAIYKKWKSGALITRSEKEELKCFGVIPELY